MNNNYLMQYISYTLHTIVEKYSMQNELLESFCARIDFDDSPIKSQIREFSSTVTTPEIPSLISINYKLAYGIVPAQKHYYIIGPVRFSYPIYFQHQLCIQNLDENWMHTVSECQFLTFINNILLAFNLYHENTITPLDLYSKNAMNCNAKTEVQKDYTNIMFVNREQQKFHNPYDQEMREMLSIENGDPEGLRKSIQEDYTGDVGMIAKSPIRNLKNIGIAVISLACRAAIKGGMPPENAYSLCDSYILKIEEINDSPSISSLIRTAEFQYTQIVHDLNLSKTQQQKDVNLHVEKCKDYIFAHLHEKITVQEISDSLQVVGTSGKTTLLHMMGGLDVPTSRKVWVHGEDISGMKPEEQTVFRRRNIGFVFQNFNLIPTLNVYENIVLPVQLDGRRPDKQFAEMLLEALGCIERMAVMPSMLSGGQ